jgi:hypothetical protein
VGTRAALTATWPLLKAPRAGEPGATLAARGWLDFGGASRGGLRVSVPRFEISDENQPATVLSAAEGLQVTGAFTFDGSVWVVGDRVTPSFTLTVEDATVASKEWEAVAEGIDTTIKITGLRPLSTPGKQLQLVLVKRAKMGELEVSDGFVAFRLERPEGKGRRPVIFVKRTEWGWAGGRLFSHDFTIEPGARRHKIVVSAEDLKLKEILALLPEGRGSGAGSLYGRLPVTVIWPVLKFDEGFLYAREGRGWLQFGDAAFIGDLLARQDPRFDRDPALVAVKNKIVAALQDFEYSKLKTDFVREGRDFIARVQMAGKGRRGEKPQEFEGLNWNFRGFDKLLNSLIITKSKL